MRPFFEILEKLAKDLKLLVQKNGDNSLIIKTTPYTAISLKLECEENGVLHFSFSVRTNSWQFNGERTDLHDVISLTFSLFLNKLGFCTTFLIDEENPATYSDSEIYARYLLPIQVSSSLSNLHENNIVKLEELVLTLPLFEQYFWCCFNGCPCLACRERLNFTYDYRWQEIDPTKLESCQGILGESNQINYCERTLPTWFYYRDFKHKTTIIESLGLADFIKALDTTKNFQTVRGNNGDLRISERFQHYISDHIKRKVLKYFESLEAETPKLILLENKVVAVGSKVVMAYDYGCGLDDFKFEKEKIYQRHLHEYETLFKPSKIEWAQEISGELFENLIKDLMEKEPNVRRVRKMSHTNERDRGVDLIAEWLVPKTSISNELETSYRIINVVIQCKVDKNGVGKSKVSDIRDTVEFKNYDGFFLAASTYLKNSLTDHLDKIKVDGKIWIDWWSRDEIDKRLIANRDILLKHASIVWERKD